MVVIRVETVFSLHGLSDQQPKTKHRMSAKDLMLFELEKRRKILFELKQQQKKLWLTFDV